MRDDGRARWTKLVSDFESSELTQREFASERGISLSNLRYWIYRLRKESRPLVAEEPKRSDQVPPAGAAGEGSRLVPVRVVASAPKARWDDVVELAFPSGIVLRFPVGTDPEYLRVVAAALP